jgi:hypothetical protein
MVNGSKRAAAGDCCNDDGAAHGRMSRIAGTRRIGEGQK